MFFKLVKHNKRYSQRILRELESFARSPDTDALDRLLILAAAIKDPVFVNPILSMLKDKDAELKYGCIYDCPLVFSLTVYACFGGWKPPEDLGSPDWNFAIYELGLNINVVSNLSPEASSTLVAPTGEAVDPRAEDLFQRAGARTEDKLICRISGANVDKRAREAAADALEYVAISSKYLLDLYWLAVWSEDYERKVNAAVPYFSGAAYRAIYRAEKAKTLGK
ncbi:MAG: hypothetical protein HY706_17700 [Candidatus Hydrogenedentes bacterium]|nr:hypothetical protein [Candidatus Hydrogenedentota bacterium]